jgi:hypothetical protein
MKEMFPPNLKDYYYTIFRGDMHNNTVFNGIRERLRELNLTAEYAEFNDWRVYRVNKSQLPLLSKKVGSTSGY